MFTSPEAARVLLYLEVMAVFLGIVFVVLLVLKKLGK